MSTRVKSQSRPHTTYPVSARAHVGLAFLTASLLAGCGSSSNPKADDAARPDGRKDVVGADVCTNCSPDVFQPDTQQPDLPSQPDSQSTDLPSQADHQADLATDAPKDASPDAPISGCTRAGRDYEVGDQVPLNDGCGGTCVCLRNGTIGNCTGACEPDAGKDTAADVKTDVAPDVQPVYDTACTSGSPCTTATGTKGLCGTNHVCKACVTQTDDNNCSSIYGTGYICAGTECVQGLCHDSTECTSLRVCDSTHTCQACTADQQCLSDSAYGQNHICLNGQCAAGNCHATTDCRDSKKLCDSSNSHSCVTCSGDSQCQADSVYGSKSICVSSQCISGACNTSTDCTSSGRLCNGTSKVCSACTADTECQHDSAYPATSICVSGQCVTGTCTSSAGCPGGRLCSTTTPRACIACSRDSQCSADAVYGTNAICTDGTCLADGCHDSLACSGGGVCQTNHHCGGCTSDTQCKGDSRYGADYICVEQKCRRGTCHNSSECNGKVCNGYNCANCTDDQQCTTQYGANYMCVTTAGDAQRGQCINSASCNFESIACDKNAADVCCYAASDGHNRCVTGTCCYDADCAGNSHGPYCVGHSCTSCDAVSGNAYFVDPVDGDDTQGTGSRKLGGSTAPVCSYRTVKAALAAIHTAGATSATITIVGQGSTATPLTDDEQLPITIPAGVTVKTTGGPLTLALTTNVDGFVLTGNGAMLTPDPSAVLTIDGGNHASSNGIVVQAGTGTVTIANVTVMNTGNEGILINSGTASIQQGVTVKNAGTSTDTAAGLAVTPSTTPAATIAAASIDVTSGTATVFDSNTGAGIAISGIGMLNINASSSNQTVVVKDNKGNGIDFLQAPATGTGTSAINGVYVTGNQGDGLKVIAGSKLRLRNSTFLDNQKNGVHVVSNATASNISAIDLGKASDTGAGHNVLQSTASPNKVVGLCLDLTVGLTSTAQNLSAVGNVFSSPSAGGAGRDCNNANAGQVTSNADLSCSGTAGKDVGITQAASPAADPTVSIANCHL